MGFFEPDKTSFVIERRAARRTRATCAASLRTLTDESFGHLWDLSETGARVSVANPPHVDESALLKWGAEKAMCRIVWVDRDMCGVMFDTPIDPEVVASSARLIGIVEQPTAEIGNIPVGRKRSAARISTGDSDSAGGNLLAGHPLRGPIDLG